MVTYSATNASRSDLTPVSLKQSFASDDYDYDYAIDLDRPIEGTARVFFRDPEIKAEAQRRGRGSSGQMPSHMSRAR